MDEAIGIYRGEVEVMMFALADILVGVRRIVAVLDGEDDDGEEAEEDDA